MILKCKSLCDIINSTKGDVMEVKESDFETKEEFIDSIQKDAEEVRNLIQALSRKIKLVIYERKLVFTPDERHYVNRIGDRLNGADTDVFMSILESRNLKEMLDEEHRQEESIKP